MRASAPLPPETSAFFMYRESWWVMVCNSSPDRKREPTPSQRRMRTQGRHSHWRRRYI